MALSKLHLCLNELTNLGCHQQVPRLLPRLLLKALPNTSRYLSTLTTATTATRTRMASQAYRSLPLLNKHLTDGNHPLLSKQLVRNIERHFATGPKSSILKQKILTKDRLYMVIGAIILMGLLKGWDKMNREAQKNKEIIKELHSSVLTAQNAVKHGRYEDAVDHYRKARVYVDQVDMSSISVQNKVILNIVDQLGHLAFELGNWEEAEVFLKETEKVMLQCGIEKEDDSYVEVILRIGYIDTIYERKDEALERFNFCIETLEHKISVQDIYSEEYSDRLTLYGMALQEFATYTKQLGMLDDSEHAFSKALNVCRSVLGPNHEQTSVLANDLATVYDEKGKFNKAIRLAEKAIKIASETAPGNLATYKYNLAHILMHKGDMARARNALREALHLAEENEDSETKALAESSILKLEVSIS